MPQSETDRERFAAEILEASGAAFATLAAGLLLERAPDPARGSGSHAYSQALALWKDGFGQLLKELEAALIAEEPEIFARRIRWARQARAARALPDEDLRAGVQALTTTLKERMAPVAWPTLSPYLTSGLEVFLEELGGASEKIEIQGDQDVLALRYLAEILEGRSLDALSLVDRALDDGADPQQIYTEVLLAAQRRIGDLWHQGDVSIAEEHLVTATTERAMMRTARRFRHDPANGKRVIVAGVAMDAHGLGVRAVADFFEKSGWRVMCLGVDVPSDDLRAAAQAFKADLIVLSTTLITHLKYARQAIEAVRLNAASPVPILVGGAAFDETPGLWRRFGADGYAPSIHAAVDLGARLVGLEQRSAET